MPERAAIVTGASRGIGYAIAEVLAAEGWALTLNARRPERLHEAAAKLAATGCEVEPVVANLADEAEIQRLVATHGERYGRLDALVNNAGLAVGAGAGEQQTKLVDLQLDVNLRSVVLLYREALPLLRAAAAEHRGALVVNLASIAGKLPESWLSVYSATKAAVIAYTAAMNRELGGEGIKSVALCPGWVDTEMTDYVKQRVPANEMIRPTDVAQAVRFLLSLSPTAVVPEIVFERPGQWY